MPGNDLLIPYRVFTKQRELFRFKFVTQVTFTPVPVYLVDLRPGLYLIPLSDGSNSYTKKLVIRK